MGAGEPERPPISATGSVLWLLAIPLLSVATAGLAGGVASSTDPAAAAPSVAAALSGVIAGLLSLRLAQSIIRGIVSLAAALVRWWRSASFAVFVVPHVQLVAVRALSPVDAPHRAVVRRRGPPRLLG